MQDTAEAIAQLATSTASYRGTVATLTTTNAKLATQLEAAHALIAQLKNEITTLRSKIKPAWQGQRPVKTTNKDSYCWSHGYQVAKSHMSATCDMQHEKERTSGCGHQRQHHGWSTTGQGMMRRGS
jgi:predicted RNase H-like nuclease (RuvC/YqgF family)